MLKLSWKVKPIRASNLLFLYLNTKNTVERWSDDVSYIVVMLQMNLAITRSHYFISKKKPKEQGLVINKFTNLKIKIKYFLIMNNVCFVWTFQGIVCCFTIKVFKKTPVTITKFSFSNGASGIEFSQFLLSFKGVTNKAYY